VDLLHAAGLEAYRVPRFKCDVELRIGNKVIAIESKVRSKGFGWFYKWLLTADGLVIKADRNPLLIVMILEEFSHLLGQNRSQTENTAHRPLAQPSPGTVSIKTSPPSISVDPNLMYPNKLDTEFNQEK